MNILTARSVFSKAQRDEMEDRIKSESIFFNKLKSEGKTNYHRHPSKLNGKWYLEQLVKNTNGSYSTTKVLVHRIKSSKFTEKTSKLLSDSIGDQLVSLGFKLSS